MKTVWTILASLVVAGALLAAAAFHATKAVLAPLPGEWAMPVKLGPFEWEAGVPSLIRLATSPWGGPLLDGRVIARGDSVLRFGWNSSSRTLSIHCSPCTWRPPGLGQERVQLQEVHATVHRLGEHLSGDITAGRVRGSWQADIKQGQLRLRLSIPATPLADGYALFAHLIPEVTQVQIGGMFSLQAGLSLPSGEFSIDPRIEGFEVSGLGVHALAGARSSCSRGQRASRLTPESWLARATIAAEDQRFYEHQGYDLTELAASFSRNQQAHRIERGASTLSQQVAKMLVTGEERSVVRKLRELLYAVEMDRTLGKARVLRLYLDNAPWGPQLCGAEAAAKHFFGVRAHELTPAQASWLAAMLHNPAGEARRWADTGQINLARAQWVALGLRGLSRKQKVALAEDMATMEWPARWAEPD